MTDLVVKSIIEFIKDRFASYFEVYSFYLPSVMRDVDILSREPYIGKFKSYIDLNKNSGVYLGYNRGTININENYNFRNPNFKNKLNSNKNKLDKLIINVTPIIFDLEITFFSQSVINIDVIENLILTELKNSFTINVDIEIEDSSEIVKIPITCDIENNSGIELLDIEQFGNLYKVDYTFLVKTLMYSYETRIYPKIVYMHLPLYPTINNNGKRDVKFMVENEYDENGFLINHILKKEK